MQVPPTIGGQSAWSCRGGGGEERRGDACVAQRGGACVNQPRLITGLIPIRRGEGGGAGQGGPL